MLAGFVARNHPQQIARENGIAKDEVDDRRTPRSLFLLLDHEFGPFDLDAAASAENAQCMAYHTRERDGLQHPWWGVVWVNPPYSNLSAWVAKAWDEARHCQRIVMLVPANRCEQPWWQHHIEPHRDRLHRAGCVTLSTRFLAGRPRFGGSRACDDGKGNRPPFGCVLLIWEPVSRGAA